jgi:hypothetical protein
MMLGFQEILQHGKSDTSDQDLWGVINLEMFWEDMVNF